MLLLSRAVKFCCYAKNGLYMTIVPGVKKYRESKVCSLVASLCIPSGEHKNASRHAAILLQSKRPNITIWFML